MSWHSQPQQCSVCGGGGVVLVLMQPAVLPGSLPGRLQQAAAQQAGAGGSDLVSLNGQVGSILRCHTHSAGLLTQLGK